MHKIPLRENFFEGVYSRISSKVSPFFIKTSITPNQMTIISAFFGVSGSILLISDSYFNLIIASIFIQIYTILDLVDGDIARSKKMQSFFGMWLDIFFDKLIDFLIILFLTLGVYFQTYNPEFLIYGIVLMGLIFFIQFVMVLNDTCFKGKRSSAKEYVENKIQSDNFIVKSVFPIVIFFRKHLSMQHTTFTFLISLIALFNQNINGLIFLTIYAFISLLLSVSINFYQIK
jgi:phosphatidylglycerophosphate synthase